MTEKKPYSQPQLFRVELNQEQAILSACRTGTSAVSSSSNPGFCRTTPSACKRRSTKSGNWDNAGRLS